MSADIPVIPRPTEEIVQLAQRLSEAKSLKKELAGRTKTVNELIDSLETALLKFLIDNKAPIGISVPLTSNGITAAVVEGKKTKGFSEETLTQMIMAYFDGDAKAAEELVSYLYDNRESEVVRKLKFTEAAGAALAAGKGAAKKRARNS